VVGRLWTQRSELINRVVLAAMTAATGVWAFALLERTPDWLPWLRFVILIAAAVGALALLGAPRKFGVFVATVVLVACLSGPTAYAVETINSTHTGSIPSAGPASGTSGGFGGGGMGGDTSQVSAQVVALLKADASKYRWAAAAQGSSSSAPYQLASGEPVMSIGGFNGSDPSPTLAGFEEYVSKGEIHYYISGGSQGSFGGGMNGGTTSEISTWVTAHFKSITVGNTTLYDLTQRTS
jgi:4-amino-4-deoxy-L-arabinose transferase-like glycosyltransferase